MYSCHAVNLKTIFKDSSEERKYRRYNSDGSIANSNGWNSSNVSKSFQLVKVSSNGHNFERYANRKVSLLGYWFEASGADRCRSLLSLSSLSSFFLFRGWATNFYAGSLARDIVPLARPLDCFRSLNVERLRSLVNSLVIANFSRGIYGNCASFCAIYAWGKKGERGGEAEILGKMLNFQEITAETDNRNTKQRKTDLTTS